MLGAKDTDNSKSRSSSFETLNVLKEAIFSSAVVVSVPPSRKTCHEVAEGKKVISAQRAFPSQIFLHSCANLFFFFFKFLFQ